MTTTHTSPTMSERFKEGHADLHAQAENAALPAAMISGEIGRETYIRLLQTEYPAHAVLDERLRAARQASSAIAALVKDEHLLAEHYAEDLRHFGVEPDEVTPSPAAQEFINLIHATERDDPTRLLALQYVRLGATNGNRYVAKKIRPALSLEEQDMGAGTKHLDPFGNAQRGIWDAFKADLDAYAFTVAEQDALVQTAREMFQAVMGVHKEVSQQPVA